MEACVHSDAATKTQHLGPFRKLDDWETELRITSIAENDQSPLVRQTKRRATTHDLVELRGIEPPKNASAQGALDHNFRDLHHCRAIHRVQPQRSVRHRRIQLDTCGLVAENVGDCAALLRIAGEAGRVKLALVDTVLEAAAISGQPFRAELIILSNRLLIRSCSHQLGEERVVDGTARTVDQHSQAAALVEGKGWETTRNLLPESPHAKVVLPDIDVVEQDDAADRNPG